MADKKSQPDLTFVYGEQPSPRKISEIYKAIQGRSQNDAPQPKKDIEDELFRRERLSNDDVEQNIRLKRVVLNLLFQFLGIETFFIFLFAFMQAIHWLGFNLEQWSFNILITATIAQITGMLFVAVRYLFPTSKENGDGK